MNPPSVCVIDFMVSTLEQYASKVWIDHVDLSSDMDNDKDYVSVVLPEVCLDLTWRSTMDSSTSLTGAPT